MDMTSNHEINRRKFVARLAGMGLGSSLMPGALWAQEGEKDAPKPTKEMLAEAEKIAGLEFSDDEREMMVDTVHRYMNGYRQMREVDLDPNVSPALSFNPALPGANYDRKEEPFRPSRVRAREVPKDLEDLAFWPVTDLGVLLRERRIKSLDLTRMYLERLKKYGPKLKCLVTLTEKRAIAQAKRADEEIRRGKYRGPLHGIPWGAKDLLAVKGYRTTWGAKPYENQEFDYDATVVRRLDEAGAVLVAKLTLGALAMGDYWFGGQTRNPWQTSKGSSGSSAGSAVAAAAGLAGFAIGTETLGSIVSPCTVCGATGLRPTFGRVSRHGAMPLSWSMDKIGPICRSVEDCALVFQAIHGTDGKDNSAVDYPFNWNADLDVKSLKIGYLKSEFEKDRRDKEWRENDLATLKTLREMGCELVPFGIPDLPLKAMRLILNTEAAAAFDVLTRENRDDELTRQTKNAWPNVLRAARMVPAVEYVKANRLRTLAMREMAKIMEGVDLYLAPVWEGDNLLLTNLTGHPCVVVPNGFRKNGTPTSVTFVGDLYGEAKSLAAAKAYQDATDFHTKHPSL